MRRTVNSPIPQLRSSTWARSLTTLIAMQIIFTCWPDLGLSRVMAVPADATSEAESVRFFENEIRPLLIASCIKCHGPEKQEGNLRLDSRDAILAGGDSGPSVQVGSADHSLLVSAVRYQELEMPPNKRLADEQVSALATWIDNGAHWPESSAANIELRRNQPLTDADRNYWAFKPLARAVVPDNSGAPDGHRQRNELDAFMVAALSEHGLTLAPPAEMSVLIRRLTFDLIGVPPSPEEIARCSQDPPDQAIELLVDRLLDDPRYGQRWGRHWLDLVRYAESDGFKQDAYRPTAYLYRDYVIDAFNCDMPYDRFVLEQLAGDELVGDVFVGNGLVGSERAGNRSSALAATGYLRHWIYEYNQRDVRNQWSNILNDLTDITGEVFLGLGVGCARCHDHKFDPILQKDYYRLQASFAAFLPRDSEPAGSIEQVATYHNQQETWEAATTALRAEMSSIEAEVRDRIASKAIDKFPPDVRPLLRRIAGERPPYEQQLADLAFRQVTEEWEKLDFAKLLTGASKDRWVQLKSELDKFASLKPSKLPMLLAAGETGPTAPLTTIPLSGADTLPIIPASFEVVGGQSLIAIPPADGRSTGRRTALATWINDAANPLSHRVIVNRVWQAHFGTGIVGNASDFGRLGQPPTHPELLDWLAGWWLEHQRSFKALNKLIVMSATYQQASQHPDRLQYEQIDLENRWLWHFPSRRLDAEQVRDAMLVAAGAIDWTAGGPSSNHAAYRRAVYTKVMRNQPDPLLNLLDAPDGSGSVAKRSVTTTPVQSLLLANSPWPLALAQQMATSLRSEAGSTEQQIELAYHRCYGRPPSSDERSLALGFLDSQAKSVREFRDGLQAVRGSVSSEIAGGKPDATLDNLPDAYTQALGDLCHVLLNSSEFFYVD